MLPKSTVLIAPLLLTRVMTIQDYGLVEYSIAWATPFTVLLALGMGGAVPYFLIKRRNPRYAQVFENYVVLMGILQVTALLFYLTHLLPLRPYLIALVSFVSVMQAIYAAKYKVDSSPVLASAAESCLYIALFLLAGLLWCVPQRWGVPGFALVLNILSGAIALTSLRNSRPDVKLRHTLFRFSAAVRFGLPLIAASVLLGVLSSGGRMLAGHFFPIVDVGIYGFLYRATAMTLVVYQIVSTVFFRSLYEAEGDELDRYFSALFMLMFLLGAMSFTVGPFILARFFANYWYSGFDMLAIYLVLATHSVYWCGAAMLEMVLYREKLGASLLYISAVSILLLLICAFVLQHFHALTLIRLCQTHLGAMFVAFIAQLILLNRKRGFKFPRLMSAAFACMLVYIATASMLHIMKH